MHGQRFSRLARPGAKCLVLLAAAGGMLPQVTDRQAQAFSLTGARSLAPRQAVSAPFSPTTVCGTISDNHWTLVGSPYVVTCDATKTSGNLAVDPGVEVRFQAGTRLDVSVELQAQGTAASPIVFRSDEPSPAPGDWSGLYLHQGSDGSTLRYVEVEHGMGISVDWAQVLIEHCNVHDNASSGLYLYSTTATVSHCTINHNAAQSGAGVHIRYGIVTLDSNEIAWNASNTRGGGVHAYGWQGGANVTVTHNLISHNSLTSYCGAGILFDSADGLIADNTIVGNSSDEDGGGVCISGASGPTVVLQNNVMAENTAAGSAGGVDTDGFTTVSGNLIVNNVAAAYGGIRYGYPSGWHGPSDKPVTCNTIVGNTGAAGQGNGVYSTVLSPFHQNTIHGNSGYQFRNGAATDIDATLNNWGTEDPAQIEGGIYDGTDDPGMGIVSYSPFLSSPDACAPPPELTYSISGRVTDGDGTGIPGVTISAGGHSTVTGGSGDYAILGLHAGSYTATPSKTGYTFVPAASVLRVPPSQTKNFTGTLIPATYTISGRVTDGSGTGIQGVTVSASGGHSALTKGNGDYAITGLPAGSYTVTPSKSGYTFVPVATVLTVPPDQIKNFTGTLIPATYTISGRVTNGSGNGIASATVSASSLHNATTDSSGNYTLSGLAAGTYTLIPFKSGYAFAPPSRTVSVPSSRTGQDFAGTVVYSVSGRLTDANGHGIPGVTVSAGSLRNATTDSSGNYTLSGLTAGTYTLIPFKSGYAFTPPSRTVSVPPSRTGQDFARTVVYSVSGRLTDANGHGIPGVTVSAGSLHNAATDSSGNYTLSGLSLGTYDLIAWRIGYSFWPPARVVRVPPNGNGQDFSSVAVSGTLSGKVTEKGSGQPVSAAQVAAGGKTTQTRSDGTYTLTGVMPGLQAIRVWAHGYVDYKSEVKIAANTVVTHNPALNRIATDGYRLPYPGGKSYTCIQGNGGSYSHRKDTKWEYAFDFGMDNGHPVVAARAGWVVDFFDGFSGPCQGTKDYCLNRANYVQIRHSDGTDTLYFHLKYKSVTVTHTVRSGQKIAEADHTGYSKGPHLDFTRHKSGHQWWSIPISFLDVADHDGVPQQGKVYTSGNYLTAGATELFPLAGEPPQGSISFRVTGQPTYTLRLDAFGYGSDVTAMRLADTEDGAVSADWRLYAETITWTFPGAFAQFQDADGNLSDVVSDTLEAVAFQPIQASFAVSPTVCVGHPLSLTNQTTPFCVQCGWNWDFGNGATSQDISPQFDYTGQSSFSGYGTPGIYTITLSAANVYTSSSTLHRVRALATPSSEFSLLRTGRCQRPSNSPTRWARNSPTLRPSNSPT